MTTSLWLELKFERATRVFELAPGDDRVVVVGSLLRADVRVDRVGVNPVHFEFERVGNDVLLKPAYGSDVCIGSTPVAEPRPLLGISLLKFAGVSMGVRVLDGLPELAGEETILDRSFASDWARHEAATAIVPPPVRTADPMITVQRPDEEVEITEVIPPRATRRPEPPRPSPKAERSTEHLPASSASLTLTGMGSDHLPASLPQSSSVPARGTLRGGSSPSLDGPTTLAAPKAQIASIGRDEPRGRRLTTIAAVSLVVLLAFVATLRMCMAFGG